MTSGIPLCGLANHSGLVQFPILTEFQELVGQFQGSCVERSDYLEWQHRKDKERKAPRGKLAFEQELEGSGEDIHGSREKQTQRWRRWEAAMGIGLSKR